MASKRSSNSRNSNPQRGPITTTATSQVLRQQNYLRQLERAKHLGSLHAMERQIAEQNPWNATQIQTRRRFTPYTFTPVTQINGTPARSTNNRLRSLYTSPFQLLRPDKIGICIRRKMRRQVLHALRLTSKGSGSKRRRTDVSKYHC